MKQKLVVLLLLHCCTVVSLAQPYQPADYAATIPLNSIKVIEPTAPFTNVLDVLSATRTVDEIKKTTQYFDGLGRPIQTVSWQTTPLKQDVVAPQVYDEYGREQYNFMPYVQQGTNTNTGTIKYNAFSQQQAFNQAQYGTQGDTYYYSKTNYEPSPLNRPTGTLAPGNSWVGSNKGVQMQ